MSNRDKCLRMWWVMAMTGCEKREALDRMGIPKHEWPREACFACEEGRGADCTKCPVKSWRDAEGGCWTVGSPYHEWLWSSHTHLARKKAAARVYHLIKKEWPEKQSLWQKIKRFIST